MTAHVVKRDRYERFFRRILEDGIARRGVPPQDPRLSAVALLGMCNPAVRWYRPDGDHFPRPSPPTSPTWRCAASALRGDPAAESGWRPMNGPLDGIRVLDLSQGAAGPPALCTSETWGPR